MKISLIIHDIRSTHNVGSLLRSADGFGVDVIYIGGYSPYPAQSNDTRLPHIQKRQTSQIAKTALGAELSQKIRLYDNLAELLTSLSDAGNTLVALEQHPSSVALSEVPKENDIVLIVGREVEGIDTAILANCSYIAEIPMKGTKESLNVSVATAIALYELTR